MSRINAWDNGKFESLLRKAKTRTSCSFGVGTVRSKKTGRWSTVIIWHDDDNDAFTHCFELESDSEVYHLAKLLVDSRDLIKKMVAEKA